jgi:hypothetical protein
MNDVSGSATNSNASGSSAASEIYKPGEIDTKAFFLCDEAAARVSNAEHAMIRAEEHVLNSPYKYSLCRMLAHIEAIASSRVDGDMASLGNILKLEAIKILSSGAILWTNDDIMNILNRYGIKRPQAVLEAFRYMETFEWIGHNIRPGTDLTPTRLLFLRQLSLRGSNDIENISAVDKSSDLIHDTVSFRSNEFILPPDSVAVKLYKPPSPGRLSRLIEDYCCFISKNTLSPTAQAALSHFQLESIKPFNNKLDRLDRLMSHFIYFHRDVLREIPMPLAVWPAAHTDKHVRALMPYNLGLPVGKTQVFFARRNLVDYCADCAMCAAQTVNAFHDVVVELEENWKNRLGKVEHGSTVEQILAILPGMPIIAVNSGVKLTGKRFSSVSGAIKKLVDIGILAPVKPFKHDHMFIAKEAMDAFDAAKDKFLPQKPIVRDKFYRHIEAA